MPDHAGFAAALTVREHVLNTALTAAHANGTFPNTLKRDLPGGPEPVFADLSLGAPSLNCEGATNLLVLTLTAWGALRVTLDGVEETGQLAGEIEVTIRPVFGPGTATDLSLRLEASGEDIVVRRWTASMTAPGASTALVAYLTGDAFKDRLQSQSHTLKRALTDPHLFDGIGNWLSDEILHAAKLSLFQLTGKLSDAEIERR